MIMSLAFMHSELMDRVITVTPPANKYPKSAYADSVTADAHIIPDDKTACLYSVKRVRMLYMRLMETNENEELQAAYTVLTVVMKELELPYDAQFAITNALNRLNAFRREHGLAASVIVDMPDGIELMNAD